MVKLKKTKPLEGISIARVSTVPFFVVSQLRGQLVDLSLRGASVTVITSPGEDSKALQQLDHNVKLLELEIRREVSIISDIKSAFRLYWAFKNNNFDIIHSTTPKAGLLCAIAAFFSKSPIHLHTFTGQTWVESFGIKRFFYKLIDRLILRLNTRCYADSRSQVEFLEEEGVAKKGEIKVLGNGSLAGVDITRFSSEKFSDAFKEGLRKQLKISSEDTVFIFVGRLAKDKGIVELLRTFSKLRCNVNNVKLLLVGPVDEIVHVDDLSLEEYIANSEDIEWVGFSETPELYLSVSDVFCLPSYREGFGTVVIESAAMGLPTIATKIYGLCDSIEDGISGILVDAKSESQLYAAMKRLHEDQDLRKRLAYNAKVRVEKSFKSSIISDKLVAEYISLIREKR